MIIYIISPYREMKDTKTNFYIDNNDLVKTHLKDEILPVTLQSDHLLVFTDKTEALQFNEFISRNFDRHGLGNTNKCIFDKKPENKHPIIVAFVMDTSVIRSIKYSECKGTAAEKYFDNMRDRQLNLLERIKELSEPDGTSFYERASLSWETWKNQAKIKVISGADIVPISIQIPDYCGWYSTPPPDIIVFTAAQYPKYSHLSSPTKLLDQYIQDKHGEIKEQSQAKELLSALTQQPDICIAIKLLAWTGQILRYIRDSNSESHFYAMLLVMLPALPDHREALVETIVSSIGFFRAGATIVADYVGKGEKSISQDPIDKWEAPVHGNCNN